ncbi:hypothetical protein TCAL_10900 [Tigriopus californicus]|uniref:DNA mismatch repair protein S5 domain-containing protein n=2 Tax=Tigriopus californicus TaxID=6832 RepID=A0A553PJU2_TIGCA|nr:hypothetical protein TCAL_10900 [Tigriopus californicus]|eukprot:TCALIF_10900-PA protein Name:"Similar to MLH1 DNA mismatch repair protein Mlh1 (Homo sapiens)" AED:0.10 eAED:0.10 QI:0/0/0/1/1/1/5/0/707
MTLTAAPILRLETAVVNRIAAGEVVQRPCNALKELLENCLDAGSTSIQIILKQGGLILLQISDNGSGIRHDDLPILCERFTTSKLKQFEDLSSIATYGFRGEALASISHVAKLTVLTKTASDVVGKKAVFLDGHLQGSPLSMAANQGTQITVEDLFYNLPTRKRALKSGAEEFNRSADMVAKYAIHNSGRAGFSLKKDKDTTPYVRTTKDATLQTNIGQIFGHAMAKELIEVATADSARLKFKMSGWITNVNYNCKKFNFLLFINHRLVDHAGLKRSLQMVYNAYLPKGTHPFIYMSLEIAPENVDVNVHPTKHEVHFLHQDEIVESIQQAVDAKLLGSNTSRTFLTQGLLPGAPIPKLERLQASTSGLAPPPKNMIRTDSREQKMDKFLSFSKSSPIPAKASKPTEKPLIDNEGLSEPSTSPPSKLKKLDQSPIAPSKNDSLELNSPSNKRVIRLASIKNLRDRVQNQSHAALRELVADHTFVGCINRRFSLIQHATKLYVVKNDPISCELFYQILLRDFGNLDAIRLNPPVSIRELVLIALDNPESGWTESDGPKENLADFVARSLTDQSEMLDDYFSMEIDKDQKLHSIPMLLADYVPSLDELPLFIMRLATEVNWDEEQACFDSFCRETARFYAFKADTASRYDADQHNLTQDVPEDHWKFVVEQVIFHHAKKSLYLPKTCLEDMTFVQAADLPDLYKVFERC